MNYKIVHKTNHIQIIKFELSKLLSMLNLTYKLRLHIRNEIILIGNDVFR